MRGAALLLVLLAGCAVPPPGAVAPVAPVVAPAAAAPAPLAWEDGSAERAAWSAALREAWRPHLPAMSRARDGDAFCPAWDRLGEAERLDVLATLSVGISRYESGHNPSAIAGKRRKVQWVGLFQLATDGVFARCAAREGGRLTDPLLNIRCAVPQMARLAAEEGRLAAIGRWWTVLRPGGRGTLAGIRAGTAALPQCRA